MARRLLVLFFAVLAVVAIPVGKYLTKPREAITSTPSAYTGGIVPVPVPPHGSACVDQILFDTDTEVARFGATAPKGKPGPPLVIDANGGDPAPYSTRSFVPGGWTGTRAIDVRLKAPAGQTFGSLCITNRSGAPVTLLGRNDDRTRARPLLHVDGITNPDLELPVTLLEGHNSSLLSRAGEIFSHASAFRMFGAWWYWLLFALVLIGVPGAIALAIREATIADRVDEAPARAARSATPASWPSERTRRRVEAVPGWAIVAAVAAVAMLYFVYWGLNTHVFQNDEDQYVYLSRWMQLHLPESLWNFDVMQRGLQRLEVWLLAIPAALTDSPGSLEGARVLNTLAFVSTSIPIYLLGRGMGLRPRWAALPAALSVCVPWAVVTTSFLTENVAYPTCLWALWAIWRTASEPSPWRDALALALLLLAGMSRTAMLLLAPLLPVVVLAVDVRFGAGRLGRRLLSSLRAHIVLWGVVGAAALVLLAGAFGLPGADDLTTRLAGSYGTPFGFTVKLLLFKIGQFFSRAVIGTGFFAAVLALPWLFGQLVRPGDRVRFAFALTIVGAGAIVLYMVNSASFDERYIVYLAPMILLPATLAIARREISPVGIGVASVLLALLVLRVKWNADQGDFGFFVSPAEMFYGRGVAERLDLSVPGDRGTILTLVPLALALAGAALAVGLRRNPARYEGRTGAALIGAVVLVILVQTHYTLYKFVNSAGSKAAIGLAGRAFADEHTPGGAKIGEFVEGQGTAAAFLPIWQEVQFYNQRLDTVVSLGNTAPVVPPGDDFINGVTFDPETGLLHSPVPLPQYMVIPTGVGAVRLRGDILHNAGYINAALIRMARPASLQWSVAGTDPSTGTVNTATPYVRFYGTGVAPGAHCATIDLGAPATEADGASFSARVGGRKLGSGRIKPGAIRRVTAQLPGLATRDHVDVRLGGHPQLLAIYVDQFC